MTSENKYLCSRGILDSCDVHSNTPISSIRQLINYDLSNLKKNSLFYVCGSAIPEFVKIFNQLKFPIILVSGDCDQTVPVDVFPNKTEFEKFINNDNIIHWFSQNSVIDHPKITRIPIGLDYHTMTKLSDWGEIQTCLEQEDELICLKNESLSFWERIPMAYSNFHFSMNTKFAYDRKNAKSSIPEHLVYYEPTKTTRIECWKNQIKYAFVISPHGNGLDCHRTWEALCLGCIPIVKKSQIDAIYDGLPVYIVNEWTDITEKTLNDKITEFKTREFQYERLELKYWMNRIRSVAL
jgi:hypothetical protein